MLMLKAAYIIIGALLLWIIFRECVSPPKPLPPSIQAHTDSISIDKARVADLEAQGSTISRRLVTDSIRHAEALQVSESRISGLTKSLVAAVRRRPEVIRDTIYVLQQSIIQEQSGEITILQHEKDSLRINYRELLKVKDAEIRIKSEMFDHLTAINTELFKRLNSEKRKGKVAKMLIPVVFVIGFLIGNEL